MTDVLAATGRTAIGDVGRMRSQAVRLRALADELERRAGAAERAHPSARASAWIQILDGVDSDRTAGAGPVGGAVALLAAVHGDAEQARREAAIAAGADDDGVARTWIALARAIAWMVDGDADAAFESVQRMIRRERPPSIELDPLQVVGLLAEFAFAAHRTPVARAVLDDLESRHRAGPGTWEAGEVAIAHAYTDPPDLSEPSLRRAIERRDDWPAFTALRADLALGMLLRRARRPVEARSHLRNALDQATLLRAAHWQRMAASELRAAGTRIEPRTAVPLSPQELRIARLAADGLTNAQIGALMCLSPRTIGSHLYRIFPKLGVTSRVQLGRMMDKDEN